MIAIACLASAPSGLSALSASALVIRTGRWNRSARFGRDESAESRRATRVHVFSCYFNMAPSTGSGSENCSTHAQDSVMRFGASAPGPQESIFFRISLIRPFQLIAAQEITVRLDRDWHRDQLGVLALQRQRQPTLDQSQRIFAEDLPAPAPERMHVALACRHAVELVAAGDKAGGDAGLFGLEPKQRAQQVDDRSRRAQLLGRLVALRQLGLGQIARLADRLEKLAALPALGEAAAKAARHRKLVGRLGRVACYFEQLLVAQQPLARDVDALGGALAPGRHLLERRQQPRRGAARLEPPP